MHVTIIWLTLVAIMLIIEIFSWGLTSIWFCLGGIGGAIVAALGGELWLQILVFAAISLICMVLVRPIALRFFNNSREKTNLDEIIGKKVLVIEAIDNKSEKGKVIYRGVEWLARSEDEQVIEKGSQVTIVEIAGVKLIVKKEN